jgi:cyanophycinase-like exopeptidase
VTRLLVIMGSGETAPTMIKPHRELFARVPGGGPAVLLDTPYGFQENADDISRRAQAYFGASVGAKVDVVTWRSAPEPGVARERALATLRSARWLFAGPGSPTYALRQWSGTPVPDVLRQTLGDGGVVIFASAAALTLGSHTVPVYEIYKAGAEPYWHEGMNLVEAATGLPAVVIPHYDNAEGGHHDTRYCYLGERRLSRLEPELPDESFILGVDEHTACVLDLEERSATVVGNGTVTVRRRGASRAFATGTVLGFDDLAGASAGSSPDRGGAAPAGDGGRSLERADIPSLRTEADRLDAEFGAALAARDVAGCVSAALGLEQVLVDWSNDTYDSDEGEHARSVLRGMVVRLGELASVGARDPREIVAPYVDALLDLRTSARAGRDFATSDAIRDRLVAAGVEIHDLPDRVRWDLPGARG